MRRMLVAVGVLLLLGGCGGTAADHAPAHLSASTTPVATSTPEGTARPLATASTSACASAKLPNNFDVLGVSFVSTTDGFALVQLMDGCAVLARSTDAGSTWAPVMPAPEGGDIYFLSATDGLLLGDALWATHDGGVSWQATGLTGTAQVSDGTEIPEVLAVEGDLWLIGADQGGIKASKDAGRSWREVAAPFKSGPLLSISRATPDDAFILTRAAPGKVDAYATHDGGASWQALPAPTSDVESVEVAALDAQHVWRLTGGQAATDMQGKLLEYSSDGGQTWRTLSSTTTGSDVRGGSLPIVGYLAQLTVLDAANLIISMPRGLTYRSSDGGTSWTAVGSIDLEFDGCRPPRFVDGEHGWQICSSTLLRTTDGGRTWEQVTSRQ